MIGNIKKSFMPKPCMHKKQALQDPGHVKDTLLHAAWSVQDIPIILYIHLIIFQLNLSNVEDVKDYKTNDNRLHCIALSLFYFMSKISEMCTMCTNYNVDSKTKYSNYIELRIKCSN